MPKIIKGEEAPLGVCKALSQRVGSPVGEGLREEGLISVAGRLGDLLKGAVRRALASAGSKLRCCKLGGLG